MANAKQITQFLNEELDINCIEDSSSNGLQIENEGEIQKIGFAVDASLETFQRATSSNCQMLIVHHGMIWDGLKYITNSNYQRIKHLINNNLALYAAHLPLDMHNKYGNNIQLANLLKLNNLKAFGYHKGKEIGFMGEINSSLKEIKATLKSNGLQTLSLDFGPTEIRRVAIVSGGAANDTFQAIATGVDLFITGESVHHIHHLAKENNINIIFGGHYETEVWGVKALMPLLKDKFNIEVEFIDIPTIV